MPELSAGDLVDRLSADLQREPASMMFYARSRTPLDRIVYEIGQRARAETVWVEVRDRAADPDPEEAAATERLDPGRVYVADGADALLPDLAATNLGLWTIGRSPGLTSAERDLADLGWLPRALRGILEDAQGPGGSPGLAVVSRAERLVPRFPEGARDAGRLIRVLKEQRWSLATTLLFRPFGEFADLFDYVARVRPGPSGDWRETRVVVERGPGL